MSHSPSDSRVHPCASLCMFPYAYSLMHPYAYSRMHPCASSCILMHIPPCTSLCIFVQHRATWAPQHGLSSRHDGPNHLGTAVQRVPWASKRPKSPRGFALSSQVLVEGQSHDVYGLAAHPARSNVYASGCEDGALSPSALSERSGESHLHLGVH